VQAGGADLQQTVHVGDHPEFDVQGARSAGLHSIWVNRSGQPWPGELRRPDGIVSHIGQIQGLLEALRR
jgi:putative hydrolase of the HAD superfamily